MNRIYQPGVAGEVEVVVSDVGDVGNSLRGRLKVAPTLPITEHLPLSFVGRSWIRSLPKGHFARAKIHSYNHEDVNVSKPVQRCREAQRVLCLQPRRGRVADRQDQPEIN